MLDRLAAFDLAAAERVHAHLMRAEETAEIAELGRAYQRLARSLRQTLTLKARLNASPGARRSPSRDEVPFPGRLWYWARLISLRFAMLRPTDIVVPSARPLAPAMTHASRTSPAGAA